MRSLSESEVAQSCPTLCNTMDCSPPGFFLRPWDFPGKSTRVGCQFLLQGIFPTQGSNPDLPHCRQTLYPLSHQGSPWILGGGLVAKSCLTLLTLWTIACQASLSVGFFRQECWSRLPFPSPGDLEPRSPALQADSLPTELPGKPIRVTLIQSDCCLYKKR